MFKKILVPIDLAHIEKSSLLIDQASKFAEQGDGELVLLNVIPEISGYIAVELPSGLDEMALSHSKSELQALVKKHGLAPSTKIKVKHGTPANEILNVASDEHIDLIMIASHKPGLSDYLLGSVAAKVVRHAHCTVMVLR